MDVEAGNRSDAITRGRFLEYLTIIWNLLEGLISVGAGLLAGSIALVGFGFDSFIESASGGALLWRLHLDRPERREQAERLALKFVGFSFLLLAAYVTFDAVKSLIKREAPEATYIGIVIAALSLIVMALLARAKRRVAKDLHSHAMEADARQTDICTYLSAILLGGLLLNALLGWWWADPVAALVMIPIIFKEGLEALRGQTCDIATRRYENAWHLRVNGTLRLSSPIAPWLSLASFRQIRSAIHSDSKRPIVTAALAADARNCRSPIPS